MPPTIVIGDVHGCLEELQDLLRLVPEGRLVFLGDLLDKGPFPVETVKYVRELGAEMVMGNHEERHLRWRRHEDKRKLDPGYVNPMRPLEADKAAQNAALSDDDVAWLARCPLALELLPGWVAVHGGLLPGLTLEEHLSSKKDRGKLLRLRWVDAEGKHVPVEYDDAGDVIGEAGGAHWAEVYDGSLNVVYGHEAHSLVAPRVDYQRHGTMTVGLDTGVCHGGCLTAMVLESDMPPRYVSVGSRRTYVRHPIHK